MNLDLFHVQDIEMVVKGKFDAVLDTIGRPETERIGINFLRKGGNYMTLQVCNIVLCFFRYNSDLGCLSLGFCLIKPFSFSFAFVC